MIMKAALPLMLCSSLAVAEGYRSFSDVDYAHIETGSFERDELTILSTWYFDGKEALGPLNEFEYINRTSNIFGFYSRLDATDDFDVALLGGQYFAGDVLLGGSYRLLDEFDVFRGTVGYLFTSNFLVSLDAVKAEDFDTDYFVSARYNHQLRGNDYIGFNVSTDDDFDRQELSSRYLTRLAGETYLAAEVFYTFADNADDFWALNGDYYFSQRTSLGLGIAKNDVYSIDFAHFFNDHVAVEMGYTTSRNDDVGTDPDLDTYRLGMTVQF